VALIIDSPWISGYLGVSHLEYYLDPELWFQANLRTLREFPEIIFFRSWWVEYGMAIEPSAHGNRIHFRADQPPTRSPVLGACGESPVQGADAGGTACATSRINELGQ
jgi:uroporphyrinogen decarboxylase